MSRLALEDPFGSLSFWGKIFGQKNDYLIARSVNLNTEVTKRFYFSIDRGLSYSILPNVDAWVAEKAGKYHGAFIGDPSALLKEFRPAKPTEEGKEEAGEAEAVESAPRQLSELERLAWTVQCIDHQTHIVFSGSYICNAAHDLIPSPNFSGLSSPSQLRDLNSYQHLRQPTDADNLLSMAKRADRHSNKATLDHISQDLPQGAWAIVPVDSGAASVTLRNLLWPGKHQTLTIVRKEHDLIDRINQGSKHAQALDYLNWKHLPTLDMVNETTILSSLYNQQVPKQ